MTTPIPRMRAEIERRLLVNYRVDPAVAQSLIPLGMRPQLVRGHAVAGVCLIKLGAFRPSWFAPRIGWRGENAAHRVAVEWDGDDGVETGVYIPRRHSASPLAVLAGGRVFPGVHERARITSQESNGAIRVSVDADGLAADVTVETSATLSSDLFATLDDASEFFRKDALGWSPTRRAGVLEGLRLEAEEWAVSATRVLDVRSSLFEALPPGSAELDHVLLMRRVAVLWSQPRPRTVRFDVVPALSA